MNDINYKNITKKNITILSNGSKVIIKPNEIVAGPSSYSSYRGLLRVNKKSTINEVVVSEIEEHDFDPQPEKNIKHDTIMIEYSIVEKVYTKENKMNKIDLSDVTFTIPISIESEDRKNNLITTLDYLTNYFKTNILICEYSDSLAIKSFWKPSWKESCKLFFIESHNKLFHKTKILNDLAKQANTPIIVSYDCDVLLYPQAYVDAAEEIRNKSSDFCYPFNQPLRHIRKEDLPKLNETFNLDTIKENTFTNHPGIPPGGCLFMNKEKFIEIGMENEKMVSWGPEDRERLERITKLDYKLKSLDYELFHCDHSVTANSWYTNPLFTQNTLEFERVKTMNKKELMAYVKTFDWVD